MGRALRQSVVPERRGPRPGSGDRGAGRTTYFANQPAPTCVALQLLFTREDPSRPHGTLMELHSDCTHTYQLIHHTQSRYVDLFQIGSLRRLVPLLRARRASSHEQFPGATPSRVT